MLNAEGVTTPMKQLTVKSIELASKNINRTIIAKLQFSTEFQKPKPKMTVL
jgi:hypothetical protein